MIHTTPKNTVRLSPYIYAGICVLLFLCSAPSTHAAAMTLRSSPSPIDTINTIAVDDSQAQKIAAGTSTSPIAIFTVTFSLEAFGSDISIPVHASRDSNTLPNDTLGFIIESRGGMKVTSGIAVGALIPNTSALPGTQGNHIAEGKRKSYTLLVVYTNTAVPDREDRIRITHLPLLVEENDTLIQLNLSELGELKTGYVELYTPRIR